MRVRDVLASPVVRVAPDAALKEVASLLVERRINAVPVVDAGDRVVGMVTRRDLLRLLARSDEDIRADLERRVAQELDALRQAVVEVRDGVVTVDADGPCRQLVEQLARTVPGVVEVRSRRPDPAP
ncbi:MAG TPA: CBS domain-containing protein [Actinomycetota bacterium]|nr:CBS domain-containing protein [Actinomycetota bacterium]